MRAHAQSTSESDQQQPNQKAETPMATEERLATPGWWPTKGNVARQDFVGTEQCARCHAKKTASQLMTPMAHAAAPASSAAILRENPQLALQLGNYNYTIARENGNSTYSVRGKSGSFTEILGWAFRVGNKGQTYIYTHDGKYYESRLSFYKSIHGLDLTTGHAVEEPNTLKEALGRELDTVTRDRCFGCHTTASTTADGFDRAHLTPGVACEACHGPGAKHTALIELEENEKADAAIFNPGRLGPVALVDFCGACHRTWSDVNEMGAVGVINVRFQPYRLENSKCWGDGDARLTCIACHDPHEQLIHEASAYDTKCLACHISAPGKKVTADHPGKPCPVAKKDCVTCHMPRVTIPRMHAPFTDHNIRILRSGAPYPN